MGVIDGRYNSPLWYERKPFLQRFLILMTTFLLVVTVAAAGFGAAVSRLDALNGYIVPVMIAVFVASLIGCGTFKPQALKFVALCGCNFAFGSLINAGAWFFGGSHISHEWWILPIASIALAGLLFVVWPGWFRNWRIGMVAVVIFAAVIYVFQTSVYDKLPFGPPTSHIIWLFIVSNSASVVTGYLLDSVRKHGRDFEDPFEAVVEVYSALISLFFHGTSAFKDADFSDLASSTSNDD